jgi:hypothetical protein
LAWQPSYSHPSLKRLGIERAQAWLALLPSSGLNNSGIGRVLSGSHPCCENNSG